jgi:hypothetical protein
VLRGCLPLLLASTALAAPPDWTLDTDEAHGVAVNLHGFAETGGFFGGGAVVDLPVAPRGFSPKHNDAFYVSIQGDGGGRVGVGPGTNAAAGVKYRVFLTSWAAPYVFVRGGLQVRWVAGSGLGPVFSPYVAGGGGVLFRLHPNVGVHVEGGWPGARGGLTVSFGVPKRGRNEG